MADYRLGKDAVVYRNTGTYGAPTWVAIDIVKDVTLGLQAGEWDGSRRGSGGWKQSAPTMKSADIGLDIVFKPGDAGYIALRAAFVGSSLIDLAVMDGPIATPGSEGLRAEMAVLGFDRDEKLEEGLMIKCKLKPGVSSNQPVWMVIP